MRMSHFTRETGDWSVVIMHSKMCEDDENLSLMAPCMKLLWTDWWMGCQMNVTGKGKWKQVLHTVQQRREAYVPWCTHCERVWTLYGCTVQYPRRKIWIRIHYKNLEIRIFFKKSVQYFAVDFQAKKSKSQDDKPSNKPSRRRWDDEMIPFHCWSRNSWSYYEDTASERDQSNCRSIIKSAFQPDK